MSTLRCVYMSWSCVVSASPSCIQPRSICLTPSAQLYRGLSELRLGPGLLQAPTGPLCQSPAGGEHFVLVSPTLSDPLSHDRQPHHNSGARASPTGLLPLGTTLPYGIWRKEIDLWVVFLCFLFVLFLCFLFCFCHGGPPASHVGKPAF